MTTETRFEFGRNWSDYSRSIGAAELDHAIAGLQKLLPDGFDPAGKSFLDIGSGSGLHSIAAAKLGFGRILCTDYDAESVRTTAANAAKFGVGERLALLRDDILNSAVTGPFDVVYSWGVLHHTGDMWTAIDRAAALVADGGVLVIAIYVKTRFCGMWKIVKRCYCRSPRPVQWAMERLFHPLRSFRQIFNGEIFRDYRTLRGMDRFYDSIDWLGGYPYESASKPEIVDHLKDGFLLEKSFATEPGIGLLGTGCAEYVFLKKAR